MLSSLARAWELKPHGADLVTPLDFAEEGEQQVPACWFFVLMEMTFMGCCLEYVFHPVPVMDECLLNKDMVRTPGSSEKVWSVLGGCLTWV